MVERLTQVVVDDTDPGIQYQGLWQVQGKYPEYIGYVFIGLYPPFRKLKLLS